MRLLFSTILILLILQATQVKAQISHGGKPWSFDLPKLKKTSVIELPAFDYNALLLEDKQAGKAKPFRYGKLHEINISPENNGVWRTLENGKKIWQLNIKSDKAYSLSIVSSKYKLNPGVSLYIYSPDQNLLIGSFTDKNNLENGYFSSMPIAGQEIVLELNVPENTEYGTFEISTVIHDYKNLLKTGYGSSGSCNVNVNCPEGADWQNEKRSVLKYIASGYLCTGALINNTAFDAKPYVLTAEHCISSSQGAASAVFWFNYESPGCLATGEPFYQTLSSSNLKATGGNLDFSLLELSSTPPAGYDVFYAGWNRSSTPSTNSICIHHPSGDIKKISLDNNAPDIGDYSGEMQDGNYLADSHWRINNWETGTTEGGSSGSPLFDQNHRIIGDLTGGLASCSNNVLDYFARFDLGWDNYSLANKQLKAWLDPLGTGLTAIDGFDPNSTTVGLDARINLFLTPSAAFCGENNITPRIVVKNNGTVPITSLKMNYQVDGGPVSSFSWTGNLPAFQSFIYEFPEIKLPTGRLSFKAFVSDPNNGTDLEHANDTLITQLISESNLQNVNIIGENLVCNNSLVSHFRTDTEGVYSWYVDGGESLDAYNLADITVEWKEWGDRKINLKVSNTCNSVFAPEMEVYVVDQAINVTIQTGENVSGMCYSISDCDGNLIFEECTFEPNSTYSKSINLFEGCYTFHLNTGSADEISYVVSELCGGDVIASSNNFSGTTENEIRVGDVDVQGQIIIYPNPAINNLSIEANIHEAYHNATFSIINLRGSVVVPRQNLTKRAYLDISKLPRGLYIIEILSSMGKFTRRFVKLK